MRTCKEQLVYGDSRPNLCKDHVPKEGDAHTGFSKLFQSKFKAI